MMKSFNSLERLDLQTLKNDEERNGLNVECEIKESKSNSHEIPFRASLSLRCAIEAVSSFNNVSMVAILSRWHSTNEDFVRISR